MKVSPADFAIAAEIESREALEAALRAFKALKEVKANGPVEIGFLSKTIKPIGLALGGKLAGKKKIRAAWLKRLATDEKAAVRCLACLVLGEIGKADPDSIVAPAHKLAADERWEVRECLANAFDDQIDLVHPEFVYHLMAKWVTDPSPNVRRAPTNALIRYGIKQPGRVIALMDKLRHDESEYVRKNVRFCLQQIAKEKHPILGAGNPDNPQVMLGMLKEWAKDSDPHSRWIIAGTLGNVWAKGHLPQAIAILKTLAADENRLVQGAVAAALCDLAKYDAEAITATVRQWAAGDDPNVRQTAALALKKLK
jgi:3-methyladenine DNA glycosylase AlkC